jgi:tetratricopeptide (TPR) repeat protein
VAPRTSCSDSRFFVPIATKKPLPLSRQHGPARRQLRPVTIAFNEGSALFALGRYGEAQKSFEQAAKIAPELLFLSTVNAAEAALAASDFLAAKRHATVAKTLATSPERQEVMGDLIERIDREAIRDRLRSRQKRREQARAALGGDHFVEAATIYAELLLDAEPPALTDAERNVLEHGFGLALLRQGRFAAAAEHFAVAAALDPRDGDSLYMQGIALLPRWRVDRGTNALWASLAARSRRRTAARPRAPFSTDCRSAVGAAARAVRLDCRAEPATTAM